MAITQTTNLNSAATVAYDLYTRYALRSSVVYSSPMVSAVQATNQTHRGSTVTFWFTTDSAVNTTPLTEDTDVTPKALADSSVTVTITEYGDAHSATIKAKGTDMLELDPRMAMVNARQCADSFEALARAAALGGTNVLYGGTGNAATADVAVGDDITASMIRQTVAQMRDDAVPGVGMSDKYVGLVSPFQSLDLREETGDAAWVTSRNYQDLTKIENGEIGTFGGVIFYETNRVFSDTDGTTSARVYRAHIMGHEAMAKAYSKNVSAEMPETRISPVTDNLRRFYGLGWYWLGGFDTFREEAIWRLETTASVN